MPRALPGHLRRVPYLVTYAIGTLPPTPRAALPGPIGSIGRLPRHWHASTYARALPGHLCRVPYLVISAALADCRAIGTLPPMPLAENNYVKCRKQRLCKVHDNFR